MQLNVYIPSSDPLSVDEDATFVVNSEADILKLGFAAARAVRAWVKRMPLVPSTGDLHFHISAEMVQSGASKEDAGDATETPRPKRKKKASK